MEKAETEQKELSLGFWDGLSTGIIMGAIIIHALLPDHPNIALTFIGGVLIIAVLVFILKIAKMMRR